MSTIQLPPAAAAHSSTNPLSSSQNGAPQPNQEDVDTLVQDIAQALREDSNSTNQVKIRNAEEKLYKLIGLDSKGVPIQFTVEDNSISIHANCPLHLVDVIRRVECAKKILCPFSDPNVHIDVKHVVFNGRVLDLMKNQQDHLFLKNYLESLPVDTTENALAKVEAILSCIDQVSSLSGQWRQRCLNSLEGLLRDTLEAANPITFFHLNNTGAARITLKKLKEKFDHSILTGMLTKIENQISEDKKVNKLREMSRIEFAYEAFKETHILEKMTSATAFLVTGLLYSGNSVTALSTSSPAQNCCCSNTTLVNNLDSDDNASANSVKNALGALGLIFGIGLTIAPTARKMYSWNQIIKET